ncbi:MAG: YkvI family membrane protein [Bacillota bacterium]
MRWMLLILGSLIGAGYASGQEIWQFFGVESGLAIFLFTVMFSLSAYVVMKISYKVQSTHFLPVLEHLMGPLLAKIYDVLIVFYLFSTTTVMIAGGGVTLQMYKLPFWAGVALLCGVTVCLFFWDINGILSVNTVFIPILVAGLLYALFSFQTTHHHTWTIDLTRQYNWPASITFTSLNILSVVAILSSVGKDMKGLGEAKIASVASGLIFGVISFVYNETLVELAGSLSQYEIPLFAVLEGAPYPLFLCMTAVLCLAIYTTTVAGVFGLSSRLLAFVRLPRWMVVFLLLAAMVPFTSFGFSDLIAFLYPIYGLLNLYLLVCLLLYPILSKWKKI